MTYPTAARLFYILVLPIFLGAGFLLDYLGKFQYIAFVVFGIVAFGAWLSEVVLRCPVCKERVGRSRNGYYAPWTGPRCRYCEADLSQLRISLHREK
jgi:hypothetical protein